jgi:hypothetical protein
LFVLMGYVMERGALVDKMFHSVQLAFRSVPGSLAVTTLIICTFWGIASGLVGAVVVLMGVIAMRPMLNAGYDTRLAAGVITAGGTLGILIPPSVMIIVYAAVAGQSVVKLYAAAMFPGFFLALLYLIYVIGWVLINPKIAPKLPPTDAGARSRPGCAHLRPVLAAHAAGAGHGRVAGPCALQRRRRRRGASRWTMLLRAFGTALVPLLLAVVTLGHGLVVRGDLFAEGRRAPAVHRRSRRRKRPKPPAASCRRQAPPASGRGLQEPPAESADCRSPRRGRPAGAAGRWRQGAARRDGAPEPRAPARRRAACNSLGGPSMQPPKHRGVPRTPSTSASASPAPSRWRCWPGTTGASTPSSSRSCACWCRR